MIEGYPEFLPLSLEHRPILHPRFQGLAEGMSELTFAGIYLFREAHDYRVSRAGEDVFVITGTNAEPFFILPFELVNREQDLGQPGLRRAKESYRPAGFVKKFRAARQ